MSDVQLEYHKQHYKSLLNNDLLPPDLNIITITITCNFDTIFNKENIWKYIDINPNKVKEIKCGGNDSEYIRPKRAVKKQRKKKEKKNIKPKRTKTFFNQVTAIVKGDEGYVNVKIFENGSLQMTGCKCINDCISAVNNLCEALQVKKAILDQQTFKTIIMKPFATNLNNIKLSNMKNLKISMVNCVFDINFMINREKIYKIAKDKGFKCKYDLKRHCSTDIYFKYTETKEIACFVFRSGKVMITGGTTTNQIVEAYYFIKKLLLDNYSEIAQTNTNQITEYLAKLSA